MTKKMREIPPEFAAYVGLDWGDKEHSICLQAAGQKKLEAGTVQHKPEELDAWAASLRQRFSGARGGTDQASRAIIRACISEIVASPIDLPSHESLSVYIRPKRLTTFGNAPSPPAPPPPRAPPPPPRKGG
jgi:hypothetical protein